MKISLCKNNKNYKHTMEFLERNLRKINFEVKDCLGECSDCKKKVVIVFDGKKISGKDEYAVFKEIKKILKKKDELDYLNEEVKEKAKDKKKEKETSITSKEINGLITLYDNGQLVVTLPEEYKKKDFKVKIKYSSAIEDKVSNENPDEEKLEDKKEE